MKINLYKHLIGLTGEYFVAGKMSMKGWVASLTLKNYPIVDIFGLNPETGQTINIQVKTTKNKKDFHVGLSRDQRDIIQHRIACPYVFVHINKQLKDDEYFNRPEKLLSKIILFL